MALGSSSQLARLGQFRISQLSFSFFTRLHWRTLWKTFIKTCPWLVKWKQITKGPGASAWIGAGLTVFSGWLFLLTPLGRPIANLSFDLPFVLRGKIPLDEVSIVYMDDASHDTLRQPSLQGWDRTLHARLIDRLVDLQVRAIVFDIWFSQATTNDPTLMNAIAVATNRGVIVVVAGALETLTGQTAGYRVVPPFPAMDEAVPWGVVQPAAGQTQQIQREHFRPLITEPTLAWRVAELVLSNVPIASSALRWFNYYGPPGHIPFHSFHRVLDTIEPLTAAVFSNNVVFVGANFGVGFTGGTSTDHFDSPWTRWSGERYPGVDLNATAYLNLARGDWLKRLNPWLEFLLVSGFGLLLGLGTRWNRSLLKAAGVAVAVAILVATFACVLASRTHIWFSWLTLVGVQTPIAFAWTALATLRQPDGRRAASTTASDGTQKIPVVPDHELLRCVGSGAYGEIWLARNVIGLLHAVKIIYRHKFDSDEPYEREFKGIQKFMPISRSHPGLVQILHVGRNDHQGHIYCIMEVADDEHSGQRIEDWQNYSPRNLAGDIHRRGWLSAEDCVTVALDLADALDYLHAQHLIHRDIKPANIIYVNGKPKLADIGLVTDIATQHSTTQIGTVGYIPPEGPGKPAADIFSLGRVLYVAVTGFACQEFPNLPKDALQRPDADTLFSLNQVILKACNDDTAKRYQTAADVRNDLLKVMHNRLPNDHQ